MPDAITVTVRCLEPGCDLGEHHSSIGWAASDADRFDAAEAFVWFVARSCRTAHAAGVEARFSDDDRRIVFSKSGGAWQ
jgi:hypothetical protein